MLRKNQKGEAALGFISLVIVLAVAGYAGWRVYKSQQQTEKAVITNQTVQVPADKQTYTNDEWRFKLTVPASIVKNPDFTLTKSTDDIKSGEAYDLSFAPKISLGFVTKDYVGPSQVTGFTEYTMCKPNFKYTEYKVIFNNENSCIAVVKHLAAALPSEDEEEVLSVLAQKQFEVSEKIAGIEVNTQPISGSGAMETELEKSYQKSAVYGLEEIKQLVASIQEL